MPASVLASLAGNLQTPPSVSLACPLSCDFFHGSRFADGEKNQPGWAAISDKVVVESTPKTVLQFPSIQSPVSRGALLALQLRVYRSDSQSRADVKPQQAQGNPGARAPRHAAPPAARARRGRRTGRNILKSGKSNFFVGAAAARDRCLNLEKVSPALGTLTGFASLLITVRDNQLSFRW